MSKEDIENLREQTQNHNRVTAAAEESQEPPLDEQIAGELAAVASGEKNPSVGTRSELLSAFLYALGEREEGYEELTGKLYETLEQDPDVDLSSKSAVVELSIRVALQEAAPEYAEALSSGAGKYAKRRM